MTLDELRTYKKILILGYGIEGKVTELFLKKFHPRASIGIADQNDDTHYLEKQKGYNLAIRTPLLRPEKITIPYTTATNLFFANVSNTTLGITGTKGKSTTAALMQHLLITAGQKSRLHGNIGTPMLEALLEPIDPQDIFVLELSSYQLEDIHYSPHIACFLNIYHELHNHTSFSQYFQAKARITKFQGINDQFFYNGAIESIAQLAHETEAQSYDFTLHDISVPDTLRFSTHIDNLKAVYDMAATFGASSFLQEALATFEPLPHRLHKIGTYGGIAFYDDSASTHPDATLFALSALPRIDTILLGGEDRGYRFEELVHSLAQKGVKNIILFPDTHKKIAMEVDSISGYSPQIEYVHSMQEAVQKAFVLTEPSGVCLLSPGAPSYTLFKNFGKRGEEFVKNIHIYEHSNLRTPS